MGTTTKHAFPWPAGTDVPAGHTQIKALADSLDNQVPIVTAGVTPSSPSNGVVWYDTTAKLFKIYDGAAWQQIVGNLQSYTPTWGVTAGTAPTIGNGLLQGSYSQVGAGAGSLVNFAARVLLGSTSTVGAGVYYLTLPFTANAAMIPTAFAAEFFDASAAAFYSMVGEMQYNSNQIVFRRGDGSINNWSNAAPVVPANGDYLYVSGAFWQA